MLKELTLFTSDNQKIRINHYNVGTDSVVIIAPGWFMTKDSDAFCQLAEFFASTFDVITLDFRGHGKSSGLYTFTAKENLDITAVVEYARRQYKNINLIGFSLGAAIVAIFAVTDKMLNKLILVSPPTDFSKIENQIWKKEAWKETFEKFELSRFLSIRPSLKPNRKIKPIEIISKIEMPTLFIAGKMDPTVHYWHTKLLYQKASCSKKFKLFENGFHAEDLFLHYKQEFGETCINWLTNSEYSKQSVVT